MPTPPFGRLATAMVTPFDSLGAVAELAIPSLVDHLIDTGTECLVVSGTTGESPTLSTDEKLALFRSVQAAARGRAKVVAGTGTGDTRASVLLTRAAAEMGMDGALLVVPPYSRPSQEGLYRHFRAIAESAPSLPCILYNVPPRTAQNLDASTCLRLANDVGNIVAVKEASGNLLQISEIVRAAPPGFAVYSGDDGLTLPILAVGGVGVVSVTSHLVGKQIRAMIHSFMQGRADEAARLHGAMLPLVRACFQATTSSPAPLKRALNLLGLPAGGLRLPLAEANEAETRIVRQALLDLGLRGSA